MTDLLRNRDRPPQCYCVVLAALLLLCAPGTIDGAASADVRTGEALESLDGASWFDSDEQTARPIPLRNSDTDAANRDSRWNKRRAQKSVTPGAPAGGGGWGFGGLGSVSVTWSILIGLTVLLLIALLYAVSRIEGSLAKPGKGRSGPHPLENDEDEAKLAELPVDIRRPVTNLLEEARRLMEAGKYDAAIVYLFSHMLIQLDRQQRIRLARGKTNRQYLRELHSEASVRETFRETILAFEDSFFGHHPLSRDRFMACWNRLDDFQGGIAHAE